MSECGLPRNSILPLNWVPVDVLAEGISRLAERDARNGLCVYHFQSATPVLDDCFGDHVARCSLQEWRDKVARVTSDPKHSCHAVRETLLAIEFSSPGGGIVDMTMTKKLLGDDFPSLDYTREMLARIK